MQTTTTLDYPDVKITLRSDLYNSLRPEVENFFVKTNCKIFNHTIHKNYRAKDHYVSSLGSNKEWLELYWSKYRNNDLLNQTMLGDISKNKLSFLSHNALDENDACMEERLKVCDIKNGLSIAMLQDASTIETMSFGWKDLSTQIEIDEIFELCHLLTPLRDLHFVESLETFS